MSSPGLESVPAEDVCSRHPCDKEDHLWLEATGDLDTCSTSRNCVGGGGSLCVHLRVYFGGGNLKLRQSISAWAASQLFTHPEPGNQSENKQELMLLRQTRVHPPPPAGSAGRYTWVVPWEPLFTFKCTHQTIWTSDQILNGVQIMQQRRLFYWGKGAYLVVLYFKALKLG